MIIVSRLLKKQMQKYDTPKKGMSHCLKNMLQNFKTLSDSVFCSP